MNLWKYHLTLVKVLCEWMPACIYIRLHSQNIKLHFQDMFPYTKNANAAKGIVGNHYAATPGGFKTTTKTVRLAL